MSKLTTLSVSVEVWTEVKNRKKLGVTTDDVLREALGIQNKENREDA